MSRTRQATILEKKNAIMMINNMLDFKKIFIHNNILLNPQNYGNISVDFANDICCDGKIIINTK